MQTMPGSFLRAPNPGLSFLLFFPLFFLGGGCATLEEMASSSRPQARVEGVRFAHADFSSIDLKFDVAVTNPNRLPIRIAGLDYSVAVQGQSLLNGASNKPLEVAGQSTQTVAVPVTLEFAPILKAVDALKGRDFFDYAFASTLAVEVPVLGRIKVPVRFSGELPILQAPQLQVLSLEKQRLDLTGAEVALHLAVENPNGFGLNLEDMDYRLTVNERDWAAGNLDAPTSIPENGQAEVTIPISLNFLQVGRTAYEVLTGKGESTYHLDGDLTLGSTLPFFNQIHHAVSRSGKLPIR